MTSFADSSRSKFQKVQSTIRETLIVIGIGMFAGAMSCAISEGLQVCIKHCIEYQQYVTLSTADRMAQDLIQSNARRASTVCTQVVNLLGQDMLNRRMIGYYAVNDNIAVSVDQCLIAHGFDSNLKEKSGYVVIDLSKYYK